MIRIEAESPWMCDRRDMWESNPEVAEFVSKSIKKANGEAWEYEDRRQAWLPDDYSQIFRLYVFGLSGLKDYGSATLRCKI